MSLLDYLTLSRTLSRTLGRTPTPTLTLTLTLTPTLTRITKELMAKLLPPVLQSGVMATVGWGIYTLAFDSLSVPGPNEAIAALTWTGGLQYGNGLALLA